MNEIKITIDTFVEELNNCVGKEAFDVFKKHRDYINWCKENFQKEPFISLVGLLEKKERDQEDEI